MRKPGERVEAKRIDNANKREERLFFDGPRSLLKDFFFVLKIAREFMRGFRKFRHIGPCVTVFGSARFTEDHPTYQLGMEVGRSLAELGFTVITGGGPGAMEAANRGAWEAGGRSIGCNIILPEEQYPNRYLDKWVNIKYFFARKVILSKYSYAFIVLPGGFGTLDEFFEALTLIQTKSTRKFPVVVMDKEYHRHLSDHMQLMRDKKTISAEDTDLYMFTDSVSEAMSYIEKYAIDHFDLRRDRTMRKAASEI